MATTSPFPRSMDDFLVNPTMNLDEHPRIAELIATRIDADAAMDPSYESINWKQPDLATPLRDDLSSHPPFFGHYASYEEAGSPLGDDDDSASFRSMNDSASTFSDLASLSESVCDMLEDNECTNAQTVRIVSVGKAKVVSLPASPVVPHFSLPQRRDSLRRENSDFQRYLASSRSSAMSSRPMTAQSSRRSSLVRDIGAARRNSGHIRTQAELGRSDRRRPSLPMDFVPATSPESCSPTSSNGPSRSSLRPSTSSTFLQHDPYPTSPVTFEPRRSSINPSQVSHPASQLRKTSPLFLNRLSKTFDLSRRESFVMVPPSPSPLAESAVATRAPTSKPKPKMMARGANERAPVITLPPCPADYEADITFIDSWASKREGTISSSRKTSDERKRKSMSTILGAVRS